MDSRERVIRTLEFSSPDRLAVDIWTLPATKLRHGDKIDALYERYPTDFASIPGPLDHGMTPELFEPGEFTDQWGCGWVNLQRGIIGEVKHPPLEDDEDIDGYRPPVQDFLSQWETGGEALVQEKIAKARKAGKFIIGGCVIVFERLQYMRGTENLYCDISPEKQSRHERDFFTAWLAHYPKTNRRIFRHNSSVGYLIIPTELNVFL